MEDTLGALCVGIAMIVTAVGLNPCFNGRYSRSCSFLFIKSRTCVLILVLMEDTLGVQRKTSLGKTQRS